VNVKDLPKHGVASEPLSDEPLDAMEMTWFTSTQSYPRGVELFHQGVTLREVMYIEVGVVKLTRLEHGGRESILEVLFPGAWLGTAAVVANRPSPVSAVACSEVLVRRMDAEEFLHLLQKNPQLSQHIHRSHAIELCRQTGWMGQLNALSSRQRLGWVIRQFIGAIPPTQAPARDIRLHFPLLKWELARLIAVTPEHLSRLMKDMQDEGLIRRAKGWIIVPDVHRLCADVELDNEWCCMS
jgi:CRP/FNR family transcriptional regulator